MPCAHPIPARKNPAGGRVVIGAEAKALKAARVLGMSAAADLLLADSSLLFLPCGSCVGCQISRARSWAIRLKLELYQQPIAAFVTLTYSDRYVPPTLSKLDLSRFFRYVRREVPVRFFGCGEYGEWRKRPHYHAIIYGSQSREIFEGAWSKGFVRVDAVNDARLAYVAGYCAKKVGMFEAKREAVDYDTGEVYTYQPPFLQMSRRPGIGGDARQFRASWRRFALWSGRPVPVPRFLHNSWRESASETELAELELEKLESRLQVTVRELDANEAIAKSRISLKSSGRTL